MFKKIHSNRDPSETLWKALRKEFGHYFARAGRRFGQFCAGRPQFVFGLMVVLLVLSAVLSFTVFRHPAPGSAALHPKPAGQKSPHPHALDDGFSRILETGAALKQTLELKQEVEVILAKGKLNHADSLRLEGALDSLGHLQHQIQH